MTDANSDSNPDDKPPGERCPSCGKALSTGAILCVECGYHLKLGRHLATVVERPLQRPIDPNPFAAPAAPDLEQEQPHPREPFIPDLTDAGARTARAIVDEADMVIWTIVVAWCCALIWPLMMPWYGYRLWLWHRLNLQFSELRNPNTLSPHGELAGGFQDAKTRLWLGFLAGSVFWVLLGAGLVLRVLGLIPDAH